MSSRGSYSRNDGPCVCLSHCMHTHSLIWYGWQFVRGSYNQSYGSCVVSSIVPYVSHAMHTHTVSSGMAGAGH